MIPPPTTTTRGGGGVRFSWKARPAPMATGTAKYPDRVVKKENILKIAKKKLDDVSVVV